jgi:hypothetical protein
MCLQVAGPCVVVVPASPGLRVVVGVGGPAVVVVVVGPAVVVVVVDVVEAGGQRRKSLRPPVQGDPTLTLENLEISNPKHKLQPHNLS